MITDTYLMKGVCNMKRSLSVICLVLVFVLALTACSPAGNSSGSVTEAQTTEAAGYQMIELVGTPTDYSDADNWLNIPEITYDVDTVYYYPTAFASDDPDAPTIVPVDNEILRAGAQNVFKMNQTAYSHCTNVFAPYYRQSNLMALSGFSPEEFDAFQYQEQRTDVYASLDYYFEHYNQGRPYILAGHSQGSEMIRIVLIDYMQAHPEYYQNMVAAYVLGYSITKDDLEYNPNLKFAQGADDTGVIVSWNIEGPGNKDQHNAVVTEGAISINPINWKRDDTYAPAEDNLGTYVSDGSSYVEAPAKADAQVDVDRGVVICTTKELPFISANNPGMEAFFGPESYHNGDYPFYLDNLKENVRLRTQRYLSEHGASN